MDQSNELNHLSNSNGQNSPLVASILFFLVKNAVFPCRAGKTCGHSGKMF